MSNSKSPPKTLHLLGINVTHSIAPPMHNHISTSLHLPWTFHATECPSLTDLLTITKDPTTAGLVITMPYKASIMYYLDYLSPLAEMIGAVNNVYFEVDKKGKRKVCGTNTDWIGIRECLLEKGIEEERPSEGRPGVGVIVGAGGASRAAVYALSQHLHCKKIYILNRDEGEVRTLIEDSARLPSPPSITHITTIAQAQNLPSPFYIVGTIPDFEPVTESEKNVTEILAWFLSRERKGVLLDMCFKPRRTRVIRAAEEQGWECVEGTHVIGYQIEEQWRLWAGEERVRNLDREGAWRVLLRAAEESGAIN
ncbi:hypothetical protein BDV12DRAFT_210666 [Aspergillus spectabilis]